MREEDRTDTGHPANKESADSSVPCTVRMCSPDGFSCGCLWKPWKRAPAYSTPSRYRVDDKQETCDWHNDTDDEEGDIGYCKTK